MMEDVRFMDQDCVRLGNAAIALLVTKSVGPRILSLSFHQGTNLFAELPGMTLECPGEGPLSLYGGHRLWHAPEVPRRTYLPDDQPVAIEEIESGILVTQPLEKSTGIQKSLQIHLPNDSPIIVVNHTLTNHGNWAVELAPWAITKLRPGGFAILPQPIGAADPDGVLPNRHLVVWPYTDINSPSIQWGNRFIFVNAAMQAGALKIGMPNPRGWLGYLHESTLFVKKARYHPHKAYFDFGSSSECYCNPHVLELETLGPRTILSPGQSVNHREVWELHADVFLEQLEDAVQALEEQLGLAQGSPHLHEEV
jgi:hypothetical protein